jgi:hypothetical protein
MIFFAKQIKQLCFHRNYKLDGQIRFPFSNFVHTDFCISRTDTLY